MRRGVVPTPVGVFLHVAGKSVNRVGRPHARGGVSSIIMRPRREQLSSPRPWGCFLHMYRPDAADVVVPTPVGVFPGKSSTGPMLCSRPHARGGVSCRGLGSGAHCRSSPRPWGCFYLRADPAPEPSVVPTPVGVFLPAGGLDPPPARRPHARGGVSVEQAFSVRCAKSSPRPWGCFRPRAQGSGTGAVVPTPVGVFLSTSASCPVWSCRPHARGGVSRGSLPGRRSGESSPRPWGCFHAPLI